MTVTEQPAVISTAEQLLAAGDIGRCELVRGALVRMSPAGAHHGMIAFTIGRHLGNFVAEKRLGQVFAAETGFVLERDPDTVRAPDVAFVRADRLNLLQFEGFFPGAPDLAVEVLSPNDSASDVLDKVQNWLDAGTSQVWIVNPKSRTLQVHRKSSVTTHHDSETLVGSDDLLPGCRLKVGDIFA